EREARADEATAEAAPAHTETLDEHGRFRFEGLPIGRLVTITGRARGFSTRELTLDRRLQPDGTAQQDVEPRGGATITGIVLDAKTRAPVPGANVWVETLSIGDDELAPATVAGADGRFRLEGAEEELRPVSDGSLRLWFMLFASAEGYVSQ